MASIAEVKAILRQHDEQEMAVAASIRAAAEESGQSLARLRTLVGGSTNPAVTQALARVEQSRALLLEAAAFAEQASALTRSYRGILG